MGQLSDAPLAAHKIGSMTWTISGIVELLDEAGRFGQIVVWSRAVLLDPGWTDRHPAELLEEDDVGVLEVKDVDVGKVPSPSRRRPPAPEEVPSAMPAEERATLAERLLRGRQKGAREGKHQSGPAPYGYKRDYTEVGRTPLVVDEGEAEVVRFIFREYLRLSSMKLLVALLESRDMRTRRGKKWSRAGIAWILKNDTYVGRVHFGDIRVRGAHAPIIAPIIFNKVRRRIQLNDKRSKQNLEVPQDPGVQAEAEEIERGDSGRP